MRREFIRRKKRRLELIGNGFSPLKLAFQHWMREEEEGD
jgi:hypothetical protein